MEGISSEWVQFAYACLEWLQGWGKWQLGVFFFWVGFAFMVKHRGWPWQRRVKGD
jgi:hypothetical protein